MGTFKGVDNFSFLRVFEAGHEVPYYRMLSALFPVGRGLTRYRAESRATSVQPDHAQETDFLDVTPTRGDEYRCRLISAVGQRGHDLVMESCLYNIRGWLIRVLSSALSSCPFRHSAFLMDIFTHTVRGLLVAIFKSICLASRETMAGPIDESDSIIGTISPHAHKSHRL